MRFHEIDPWQTWQERLERQRLLEPPSEMLPFTSAAPELDPTSMLLGQRPGTVKLHFPTEVDAVD